MQSKDVPGLSTWAKWRSDVLKTAPDSPGIYVLRLESGQRIERLIGSSDIVYIGCSVDSTVRSRLTDHYKTNDSFRRVRKEVGEMEVSWRPLETDREVRLWESDLIVQYERDHIELPPLNRTQPWTALQQLKVFMKAKMPPELCKKLMVVASENGYPLEMPSETL